MFLRKVVSTCHFGLQGYIAVYEPKSAQEPNNRNASNQAQCLREVRQLLQEPVLKHAASTTAVL
jgi:hypothetical protein